jgi:PAS domain S-box-containing protein
MEFFYTAVAIFTAGVSFVTGLISLLIGLHKDGEKVDLIFGLMGLSLFVYFLFPPIGFVLIDKAPYPVNLDIKRLFIYFYLALFPWFLEYYSGFKIRVLTLIINALIALSYITNIFTVTDSAKPFWLMVITSTSLLTFFYGLYLTRKQIKSGEKTKGYWLLSAITIYGVLISLGAINQFGNNYFGKMLGTKLFFPFNLNPLAFMVIMSIRLRENIFEKYRLEKMLHWRDSRWNLLEQNIHLLIVELDDTGRINYLNPYAVKTLGYNSQSELVGKNWFNTFPSKDETGMHKSFFHEAIKEGKWLPNFVNHTISNKGNELIISWTNVFVSDENSKIAGVMSIGLNITEQEKAFEEIQALKIELEKENVLLKGDEYFEESEEGIIGHSSAILYAIQKAQQVAKTNATVLLQGETGVGKELFANLIHKRSYRCNKSLIKINCAVLPPELIESELFGHEKGSFTGALQARKGRFELANGGTIFLDEISELPLALQSKLLRVLQNGEFQRIGGEETIKVDVRVISATNRNLLNEVRIGHFREDLYYRLNVFPITIPPLRNRREDIPLLVKHFIKEFSQEHNKQFENVSKGDMIRLNDYSWRGNIRELINVIERSVISSKGKTLKLDWLNDTSTETALLSSSSIEDVERAHILKVLTECNWKISGSDGAAGKLGLNPSTLRSRLKKLNIIKNEIG